MTRREGLVVFVPRGFDRRRIPAIIQEEQDWILHAAAEMQKRRGLVGEDRTGGLPDIIKLCFAEEEWRVEYRQSTGLPTGARARDLGGRLVCVTGDVRDETACRQALSRWVARRARGILVPAVQELARTRGFQLGKVSIRRQRTRWGSCSRRNGLSLNAKLVFLPRRLVEYVLLHELCHTVHLDHSRAFWDLLASLDPDWRRHRSELRSVGGSIPEWFD